MAVTVKWDSWLPHVLFFSKKSGAIAPGKLARDVNTGQCEN